MSLLEKIEKDIRQAMKKGEKELVSALRMLVSALKYERIEQKGELSQKQAEEVLRKEAKKRREAIELYRKGGREDLEKKEQKELELIESYLPEMMSEEEVREKVRGILEAEEFASFGQAMGHVMGELKDEAEGSVVSKVMKEEFGKNG